MSLIKHASTIGGLTMVSRLFGFARDMLLARVLGAGLAADAFQLAFRLPNTFRRLFADGAFSVAFVPMYSKILGGLDVDEAEARAKQFTDEVLSVFIWVLTIFSVVAMLVMPWIVYALASSFQQVPGKFELAVLLSRLTFPYLAFISLTTLLAGILNSRSRFGPGAFAPVLFNLTLISGIVIGTLWRGDSGDDKYVTYAVAVAVAVSGLVQFLYLWWTLDNMGLKLTLHRPRITADVKQLGKLILPAAFGAGIYQISMFIDTFFATSLPEGSLTMLAMADRLNQMPLGIVGIALGTAILPMIARSIGSGDEAAAQRVQQQAVELATLLTLPAAVALAVCAHEFVAAFFVGGRFTAADGIITGNIVIGIIIGLPAYVLVKVLIPGFFARGDTATPVRTALAALGANVALILLFIGPLGVFGLALAGAIGAWINTILLYTLLHKRGQFSISAQLASRIARQAIAAAVMGLFLWRLMDQIHWAFAGQWYDRIWALLLTVASGGAIYAAIAYLIGGLDREQVKLILRRGRNEPPL